MSFRVLVCGSRDWSDAQPITALLNGLLWDTSSKEEVFVVIDGAASGADSIAADWAESGDTVFCDVLHESYPADWIRYGKSAGPIRNKQMLDEGRPDLVVAFSDRPITKGTQNMINQAKAAGVPVWVLSHE